MSAIPQVPPRPTRSHHHQPNQDTPQIPPRPSRRTSDRSQSPNPENFPRSPFNEPPLSKTISNSGGLSSLSRNTSHTQLAKRPSVASIPSIGQEGNEYADIEYNDNETAVEDANPSEPREMRNVAGDLPLHAPKPSISKSTAKDRVSTVTRTDSSQAAAAGIGKATSPALSPDDSGPHAHPFRPKHDFRVGSAASTERPSSVAQAEDEHGIPEIGQRVPMYPDAGDVQAPSPAPFPQQHPVGIGFHNSGAAKPGRHHRRSLSGREVVPPGSYGMHGHGMQSTDHFERDWYAKHPEALEREEHGEYGPGIGGGRGEWAMSSDDLNKLVRESAKAAKAPTGLPNEQFVYDASEEYASRLQSPTNLALKHVQSNPSQPHVESPLRRTSFPVEPDARAILQKTRSMDRSSRKNDNAVESETETEDEGIRLPPPTFKTSKYTGNGYDPPTEDLGPRGGNTEAEGGFIEETGYGVPILASDEVAKTPGAEFQQPAISPAQERRGSGHFAAGIEGLGEYQSGGLRVGSRGGSAANSRPTSRPGSIHSIQGLSRFTTHDDDRDNMHTPLEDVDEYEPLFSDEEGNFHRKPMTVAQRLKLREQMKRFPSQDIWEDSPDSARLEATVETPEASPTQTDAPRKTAATAFETVEQEAARKGEPSEAERAQLIPAQERLAKSNFKPHLREEMDRPSIKQRFPSQDIWEDSPDSARLETTVDPRSPEEQIKGPTDAGLEAGAVVQTSGSAKDGLLSGPQSRDLATAGGPAMEKPNIPPRPQKYKVPPAPETTAESQVPPSIPTRPAKKQYKVPPADAQAPIAPSKLSQEALASSPPEASRGPEIPDRPKPRLPARPIRPAGQESSESTPLSKVTSASSVGSEGQTERELSAPRPKPAIPARPAGGKLAGLKAGFLGDLESRLKLGPQGPKPQQKEEQVEAPTEEEKAPLADARKGRAKGPAKRRAVPATAVTGESVQEGKAKWSIQVPWTVWETEESGHIVLTTPSPASVAQQTTPAENVEDRVENAEAEGSNADLEGMRKATQAVKDSIKATHPLADPSLDTPRDSDPATPGLEEERNPLSKVASTAVSSNPSTVISPDPAAKQALDKEAGAPTAVGTEQTQASGDVEVPPVAVNEPSTASREEESTGALA